MKNPFDLPSVDGLIEGVHYREVTWSFAEDTEANILRQQQTNMPSRGMASTFSDGQSCPEGEKMVFGMCRKIGGSGGGEKDFDSSKKTKQGEDAEAQASKEGSTFKNNKMIKDVKSGKKLGWAMKGGKPVLVEWGSVAGEKKVGPKKPANKPKGASTGPGVTDNTRAGQRQGNDLALLRQGDGNEAGREAQLQNRRNIEAQARASG